VKTALVTGATDGIGRETARQLGALGWRVIVHGRSETKARTAAGALAHDTPKGTYEPAWGDLSRMQQVVAVAKQVIALTPSLDALVNNAGVSVGERIVTEDGFELTMAVNHFAHYLLTRHLLAAVCSVPGGRVVTVSSMTHSSGQIDLNDLALSKDFDGYRAYATSKLANILFTVELAKRIAGMRATANCCHPGVISTKLLHSRFGMGGAPVERGARTSVYLASAPEVASVTGKYFDNCREVTPSLAARDAQLAESLWDASERLVRAHL
jgi:NAD(P)-dependent dehydrogenase (short-subunit alcohol dehydrogenase family)